MNTRHVRLVKKWLLGDRTLLSRAALVAQSSLAWGKYATRYRIAKCDRHHPPGARENKVGVQRTTPGIRLGSPRRPTPQYRIGANIPWFRDKVKSSITQRVHTFTHAVQFDHQIGPPSTCLRAERPRTRHLRHGRSNFRDVCPSQNYTGRK